eukprot:Tamp_36793.p1 GENE.Tamp_36793~~Tamp_36793.p1  ORF type:complete len:105 (-),score=2.05 Tamp_36793:34-348(-)
MYLPKHKRVLTIECVLSLTRMCSLTVHAGSTACRFVCLPRICLLYACNSIHARTCTDTHAVEFQSMSPRAQPLPQKAMQENHGRSCHCFYSFLYKALYVVCVCL